jgi:hypothetical protein
MDHVCTVPATFCSASCLRPTSRWASPYEMIFGSGKHRWLLVPSLSNRLLLTAAVAALQATTCDFAAAGGTRVRQQWVSHRPLVAMVTSQRMRAPVVGLAGIMTTCMHLRPTRHWSGRAKSGAPLNSVVRTRTRNGAMATKYEPLELHLRAIPAKTREVTLQFSEIERILGAPLPQSALTHRPWWANQKDSKTRPQAHAWLSAGFEVESVNPSRAGSVRFKRR